MNVSKRTMILFFLAIAMIAGTILSFKADRKEPEEEPIDEPIDEPIEEDEPIKTDTNELIQEKTAGSEAAS